jgi:hypothetical protein
MQDVPNGPPTVDQTDMIPDNHVPQITRPARQTIQKVSRHGARLFSFRSGSSTAPLNALLIPIIPVLAALKFPSVTMVAVPISGCLLIGILEALEMVYVVDHPLVVHYNDMIPDNHVPITPR